MRKSNELAETVARLDERDEVFDTLEETQSTTDSGLPIFPLEAIAELLDYKIEDEKFGRVVNRAKTTVRKSGKKIAEHFVPGDLFDLPGNTWVTVYAAFLIIVNADPEKDLVAKAQDYFTSKADSDLREEEKRLRNRMDVIEENKNLNTAAKVAGVKNFGFFNGAGYKGMYGGRNITDVAKMKGLKKGSDVLDFAGSEELAAHLFRITQTRASLERDSVKNESAACNTHYKVGREVRNAISKIGGTMPEKLPAATERIDTVTTKTKKRLDSLDK